MPSSPTPSAHEGNTVPTLPLPTRLGSFRLEEVLARGGSATVYAARGERGEPVTVKVLHTRIHEPGVRVRFEREASIRITHPNVVRVLGAGVEDGGIAWIAMERLHGEPLSKRLSREPLSPWESVRWAVQAARGLEAAHAEGIVHRDIKPENLFLCEEGTLKVLDFGIALHQDRGTRLTTTGVVLGTPWYLAPEQALGRERLDARVDVWALGAVLYEMLCGRPPFERESPIATVVAILHDPLDPLQAHAPHVPAELAAVVERCLEREPSQRWSSMEALRQALEHLSISEEPERPSVLPSMRPGEAALGAVLWLELRDAESHERARCIVEQWGGCLLDLESGGGTMAFFGGERARGDEARRAAEAALRIGARRAALSVDRLEAFRATLHGPILERARQMAARHTEEGVVLVDPEAIPMLGGRFVLEPRGAEWVLLERRATTSRPPARLDEETERITGAMADAALTLALGREPPLVGREVEKARLRETVERLLEERSAGAVLLVGPPGIGKRRLRRELQRMLRDIPEPPLVLRASAEGPPGRRSFGLFAEALRRHAQHEAARCGWPSMAASAPASERVQVVEHLARSALGPSAPDLEQAITFLGALLDVPVPETAALRLARQDRQVLEDQIRRTLDRLLEGWLLQRPLALLFDHLQWADPASLSAFEGFLERFAHAPLLLAGTLRPELCEAQPRWLSGLPVEWIRLRGLSRRHVAKLAASVAGRPLPEDFVARLHAHTGGTPLFVEQIVSTLRDEGALQPTTPIESLPRTVEAAVQAHLDALPELVRALCVRTALLERPFDPPLVAALGVVDAPRVLEQARQRGVLEARPGPDGHRLYRFRSPLAHQVARRMLDSSLRIQLAERAARALEERPDADAWELGRLWETAEHGSAAAAHYARVAEDRAVPAERALLAAERALALGGLEEPTALRVLLAQAASLGDLGRNEERARILQERLTSPLPEPAHLCLVRERAAALWYLGRIEEAIEAIEALGSRLEDPDAPVIDATLAWLWLAQMRAFAARIEAGHAALEAARARCPEDAPWVAALLTSTEGHLLARAGRIDRAMEAFERAARQLEQAGDPRRAANARGNHASALNDLGAYGEAERALRHAVEVSEQLGARSTAAYQRANLSYALGRTGRFEEAVAEAERALRFAERHGLEHLRALTTFYSMCIEVHCGLGRPERLAYVATRAMEAAAALEAQDPAHAALCRAVAGRAYLERGEITRALEALRTARTRLAALAHPPPESFEARVHLARALQRGGEPREAESLWRSLAEELADRARRIEAPRWRRRFLHGIEAHALVARHPLWQEVGADLEPPPEPDHA